MIRAEINVSFDMISKERVLLYIQKADVLFYKNNLHMDKHSSEIQTIKHGSAFKFGLLDENKNKLMDILIGAYRYSLFKDNSEEIPTNFRYVLTAIFEKEQV